MKIELILEMAPIAKFLKLANTEDEDSIKRRLEEALKQHEDDAEADPVRESEERTNKKLAEMEKKIDKLTEILQKLQKLPDEE